MILTCPGRTPQIRAEVPLPVSASYLLPGMAFSPSQQIPECVLRLGRNVAIPGKASLIFQAELSRERHFTTLHYTPPNFGQSPPRGEDLLGGGALPSSPSTLTA